MEITPINLARFWSKVDVQNPEACWEWRAKRSDFGYGVFKSEKAHRVAYQLLSGPIPDGLFCLHKCDNPPCCNPHHIFLGTLADNNRDAAAKGRRPKGEKHPRSKLTDEQVEEIRNSPETGAALARKFGVSKSTVSGIRTYTHWV